LFVLDVYADNNHYGVSW